MKKKIEDFIEKELFSEAIKWAEGLRALRRKRTPLSLWKQLHKHSAFIRKEWYLCRW